MNFPSSQHLLDEMSDLEAKLEAEQGKCDPENDLATNASS